MEDYSGDYFPFEQHYSCYSLQRLDEGDKIIMPLSALHLLTNLGLDFPFLFQIRNPNIERPSHCGVLEFTAEEGTVSLPQWMMDSLCLGDGDLVRLNDARLPRGRYIKLRPHTKEFVALSSVKAVLERKLRLFSCLTAGDTIMILYNGARFYLDVVDTQPSPAVCIIDADCEVDFAPPLDYVEPERSIAAASDQLVAAATNGPTSEEKVGPNIGPTNGPAADEEPKFRVFTGAARRLDGAPVTTRIRESTNVGSKVGLPSKPGKVVFGSCNKNQKSEGVDKVVSKQGPKEEEEKNCFQPFTGRKHTLNL